MSETKTSQVRETQQVWKKMVDEHVARVEQACAEVAKMQEQAMAQHQKAIDDMARLGKDSADYLGQLSASFTKLTLEATRQAASFMTAFQG
jgi:hypothetical protein